VNWDSIRDEFPALREWTYLNTATFGQLPRRTTEAVAQHFAHRDELACSDFLTWYDDMDRVRASVGRLIHCRPEDVAFITNASSALGLVLAGLEWQAGDRIVTLTDEFPNNLYAPHGLEERGVEFVECPWEQIHETVNERTRLVVVSSANYNTGFVPPLAELSKLCKSNGAVLFVDGTQSLGALQFDSRETQPDVLAVHGYKWLISPTGAGFLYITPELRERLRPNVVGWRSHHDWRSVDNLHHGMPVFSDKAEKYEAGGLAFPLLYGMGSSVDLMLEIGPAAIEKRVLDLANQVRQVLRKLGAQVLDYRSAIVAARFPDSDVSLLAKALREKRVLVAARKGHLRVSPHFYNNEADIETFAKELRTILAFSPS
jgi:selenocysteine lyase/cysteine desulfurase